MSKLESILEYLMLKGTKSATELASKFGLAKTTVERYMRRPEVRSNPGFVATRTEEGLTYTYVSPQESTEIDLGIGSTPISERSLIREFGKAQVELATDALIEKGELHELITTAGTKWFVKIKPSTDNLLFKGCVFKRNGNTWEEVSESEVTSKKWETV